MKKKKTIKLLYKLMRMGIDREKAIEIIDRELDYAIGYKNRKPFSKEKIPKKLFNNIIFGLKCEQEWK